MKKDKVVISFLNTPSGLFKWWDNLSFELTKSLNLWGIDHIFFYKSFTENSVYLEHQQKIATEEDLNCKTWLLNNILPIMNNYEKVIIHTHSYYPPTKFNTILSEHKNVTWCSTEHRIGSSKISLPKRIVKRALRHFNFLPKHIIAVSHAGLKRNQGLFGKKNQHLIVNGIDLKMFSSEKIPSHKVVSGCYIGRIHETKGIWRLLDAINYVVYTLKRNNFSFDIVGGDLEQQSLLNEYVKKLDLSNYIKILGYQHNPSTILRNNNFVIIPTLIEEALSLAALEARSIGRPVLYSNKGGLPETMIPNKTGIIMNDLSIKGMAGSFEKMLDSTMIHQGIDPVDNNHMAYFDHHRMFSEYQFFYNQIFNSIE